LIYGYIDQRSTKKLLKNNSVGTFLLRFSDSSPNCLVFSSVTSKTLIEETRLETEEEKDDSYDQEKLSKTIAANKNLLSLFMKGSTFSVSKNTIPLFRE
jgi:hypothetical protein